MKTIHVDLNLSVPSNNCRGCKFYKESKKVVKGINVWGREFDSSVKWAHKCVLFDVNLDGCKKCQRCKDLVVE